MAWQDRKWVDRTCHTFVQKIYTELILESPKTVTVHKLIPESLPTVTAYIYNSLRNFTCIVYLTNIPIQTLGVRNCYPRDFVCSAPKMLFFQGCCSLCTQHAVFFRDFSSLCTLMCCFSKSAIFSRDFVRCGQEKRELGEGRAGACKRTICIWK